MRQKIIQLIENSRFQNVLIVLIILNAIILGMQTSKTVMNYCGNFLTSLDAIILYVFVVEIALRLVGYGWRFFLRPWSVFDFIVVGIGLAPATEAFSTLRALRILRVLRLISSVPSMRRVVEGLLSAIPGFAAVASILMLFFYVFGVIGTHLYGETFPEWFGTLGNSMFSLFQIMTLESWSMGIVRPIMAQNPYAWVFFILFILITTFMMLNLFIAIIVNSLQETTESEAEDSRRKMQETIGQQIQSLEERLVLLIEKR